MRTSRRTLLAIGLALAAGAAGCAAEPVSPSGTASSGAGAKKLIVGYSVAIAREPTFEAMIKTVEKHVKDRGGEVYVADANFNPNQQLSDIDSLIQRGVNVLLVAPIDTNGLQPAFQRARDKKIPIIVQEGKSNSGEYFVNLVTDNFEASQAAAKYLAENGGGPAVAIQGEQIADLLITRKQGFDDGAKAAGMQVLDTKFMTQNTDAEARGFAEQFKQRHGGSVHGLFAWNTLAAVGAVSALGGSFNPKVVSLNANPVEVEFVKGGKLLATWSVVPVAYAKMMVQLAQQAVDGQPAPAKEIHVTMPRIDKSNVDKWVPWDQQIAQPLDVKFETRDGKTYLKTDAL
ncbi:sugar ABC transporter substrate-binding protein [Dactylosporangium siamense]|uniref:LacI family transcriptional regulator n=1 Tax=Dactylosporangium siamense TaxID=685454 RepID=A0A919PEP9_9ACTN|nr:sugar ABC transporter substrate-binding protein [Dactylosporangium siamense]GIG42569.1 LacI family transcriptional regulator [Dactylosporangium siamense]